MGEDGRPDPRTGGAAIVEKSAYDWEAEKKHWAYQPVKDPQLPAVKDPAWSRTAIDRFIKAKLDEKGLRPMAETGKRELLRRVTYDLTGMPPTPQRWRTSFPISRRKRSRRSSIGCWHLRDMASTGDVTGSMLCATRTPAAMHRTFPVPEMYRYRNYVIRSIQQDKPFDQFLREQLAGDLMAHKDDEDRAEKLAATSYIANSRRFGQTEYEFYLTIDDTIENLGKAVLGLSTGCARCHDHKFDPIPTKDYYALAGIFKSTKYPIAGLEHHQYLDGYRRPASQGSGAPGQTAGAHGGSVRSRQKGRRQRRKGACRGPVQVSRSLRRSWPDPSKLARYSDDLRRPRQYAGRMRE